MSSELVREAHCLGRATAKTKAFTFTLSAQNRDVHGTYRIAIPDTVRHCVSLEVAAFESQAVEQNVSEDENRVVWTEGLRMSTGEAPTVHGGIPVFDHEICLRETQQDGVTYRYFKVGLCPQLNEVSTQLWDSTASTPARVATIVSGSSPLLVTTDPAKYFFSTTRNKGSDTAAWAAPHYMEALQELVAAGELSDMRAYAGCMAQLRHIDLTVAGQPFVFRPPSAIQSEGAPPPYGGTQFQVASAAVARTYLANLTASGAADGTQDVSTSAVAHGFLCCSPWHFPDIVTMLNHQLKTVTDSTTSDSTAGAAAARTKYNRCGTSGNRPANLYEFQYAEGRFRLLCKEKVLAFEVLENTAGTTGVAGYRDVFHGNGTKYDGTAQTVARATVPSAPTGTGPHVTSLWRALGFRRTVPAAFSRETTRGGGVAGSVVTEALYGFAADDQPACVLETALQPAYYAPQTFADALSLALNGGRPKAAPSAAPSSSTGTSAPQFVSACAFVDSLGVTHALLLPAAGPRTPHQYAAGLEFLLNRTDTRGALYSGGRHSYDETYAQWIPNGRSDGGSGLAGLVSAKTRLWYTCTYDASTGTFSVANRELDGSLALGNPYAATLFPATAGAAALQFAAGTATSGGVSSRFTLSFRAADVAAAAAAQLATNGLSATATFAAIFGFDAERLYEGTVVSSTRRSTCYASHAQTLTRGQLNDVNTGSDSTCLRPLDDAVGDGGNTLSHSAVNYRGSGPDDREGPRYCYSLAGSAQNDKQLTVHAAHPATPASASNAAVKSGNDTATPTTNAYNNNTATVAVVVAAKQVTSFAVGINTTDTRVGSIHVITDDASSAIPNEAFFRVATTGTGGTIATATLLFGGSGTATNPYTTATTYPAYQLNATQDLRVAHGTPCNYTNAVASTTGDASRVLVQAASVREALPSVVNGTTADWRCFQQALPFVAGDLVLLGLQQSVLLGSVNQGLLGGGGGGSHYLTITQVSAEGHLIAATATKANPSGSGICVGQHYVVQQGDCRTVVRVVDCTSASTSYTLAVVQRGTGHEIVASKKVWLFGPIVPYMVGLVEEVAQMPLRRRTAVQTEVEGEFTSQWAPLYTDPGGSGATITTVTSLARDGSCLKIRLPLLAQYVQLIGLDRYCHPSNLLRIASLELPRFQLLNSGPSVTRDYARDDTVWPAAGLLGDSDVGAGTVKLPNEWDLDSSAGILIALADPDLAERNHVFAGPCGIVENVVAQVTFGARVARSWASVHAKRFAAKHLQTVGLQLLDYKGNTYNLRGRACRITLNVHYL